MRMFVLLFTIAQLFAAPGAVAVGDDWETKPAHTSDSALHEWVNHLVLEELFRPMRKERDATGHDLALTPRPEDPGPPNEYGCIFSSNTPGCPPPRPREKIVDRPLEAAVTISTGVPLPWAPGVQQFWLVVDSAPEETLCRTAKVGTSGPSCTCPRGYYPVDQSGDVVGVFVKCRRIGTMIPLVLFPDPAPDPHVVLDFLNRPSCLGKSCPPIPMGLDGANSISGFAARTGAVAVRSGLGP